MKKLNSIGSTRLISKRFRPSDVRLTTERASGRKTSLHVFHLVVETDRDSISGCVASDNESGRARDCRCIRMEVTWTPVEPCRGFSMSVGVY